MKYLVSFISLAILLFATTPAMNADNPTMEEILSCGLRVVDIKTIDGEEPTCDIIEAPSGMHGIGITNAVKVPGSVTLFNSDGSVAFESGDYEKKESGMTVKVRGNTSALYAKKPFKIKLEKKGDLMARGDKNLRDKNWVLLTNRNNLYELGFMVSSMIGMPWTPAYEYVNVIINGDYRGIYLLVEAVERNETCRIQTEESGFVAERDPYWWNEDGQFFPSIWNPHFNWTMKYPDFEDLTDAQSTYIQNALKDFEEVLTKENYGELIDIDSFAKWVLAQDILGTVDGGGTNFYIAKNDDTSNTLYYIPTLWDVDSGEDAIDRWSSVHNEGMIKPLFENPDVTLKRRYIELYNEQAPEIFETIEKFTQELRSEHWDGFNRAVELNNDRWGENNLFTSDHNADDMDVWFPKRKIWLDSMIGNMDAGADKIMNDGGEMTVTTLQGIKIYSGAEENFRAPEHGIYIVTDKNGTRKIKY